MDNSLSRALGSRALITHTHASRPARTLDDDGDVPGRRTAVHGRGAKAECPAGPCRWFRPAAPGAGAAAACCTYTVACHHRCCRSPPSPSVTAAAAAPVGGEPEPRDGLRATQFNVIARREAIAHRGKRRAPYEKKKKSSSDNMAIRPVTMARYTVPVPLRAANSGNAAITILGGARLSSPSCRFQVASSGHSPDFAHSKAKRQQVEQGLPAASLRVQLHIEEHLPAKRASSCD